MIRQSQSNFGLIHFCIVNKKTAEKSSHFVYIHTIRHSRTPAKRIRHRIFQRQLGKKQRKLTCSSSLEPMEQGKNQEGSLYSETNSEFFAMSSSCGFSSESFMHFLLSEHPSGRVQEHCAWNRRRPQPTLFIIKIKR